MPEFGSSSTPAFDTSSTPFGGSTGFGQKPASEGFGSTPTQNNPFASDTQPSQPAFGSNIFGSSTPFGASSQPTFGATSTSAFGATTTPTFVSTGSAFGVSNGPFGGGGAFRGSSNPMFGSKSTSAFRTPGSPILGSSFFYPFPCPFGGQRGGSRVASYSATVEADSTCTFGQTVKLESISAMHVYKDKSHEELRWEDYQLGDKGGPLPFAQSTSLSGFSSSTTTTNVFSPSPPGFGQSPANPFSSTTPNPNPFVGFGTSTSTTATNVFSHSPPGFGQSSTNPFSSTTPNPNPFVGFGTSTSTIATNESIQYACQKRPTFPDAQPNSGVNSSTSGVNTGIQGSSCVICLDAPAEGACVPCGHVAGCMSCLNVVKTKKRCCPICRAKIDQIIKLYHV